MDSQKPVKNLLGSRHNRKLLFSRKSEVVFIYAFLIAFIIVAATLSSHFLGMRNVRNLFSKNVGLLLVSLGQMFVILLGGVDLSTEEPVDAALRVFEEAVEEMEKMQDAGRE